VPALVGLEEKLQVVINSYIYVSVLFPQDIGVTN
jgi:hypothetical protein